MRLHALQIHDFRILRSAAIEADAGLNLFVGPNAAGKTSVLEALHVLARGRSFRTPALDELVRRGADGFLVRGLVGEADRAPEWLALARRGGGTEVRIGAERGRSAAPLAGCLRVALLDAGTVALVDGPPSERRALVDWGVFHVEPRYLEAWRRYRRALRQYNAALRARAPEAALAPWRRTLAAAGEAVDVFRAPWLERWQAALGAALAALDPLPAVRVEPKRGWRRASTLEDALGRAAPAEREAGFCRTGPHALELRLTVDGLPARRVLSRGQQKLLALAMVVAAMDVAAAAGRPVVALVDDLAAELDRDRRRQLASLVAAAADQVFATAVEADAFPVDAWPEAAVFHVEQGVVRAAAG